MKTFFVLFLFLAFEVLAEDIRVFEGPIKRDPDGSIIRSTVVIDNFRKLYKCPSTKSYEGKCPGWSIDHVIPLSCNGVDDIYNIQWLPNAIKSAKGTLPKDRWERTVYCKDIK